MIIAVDLDGTICVSRYPKNNTVMISSQEPFSADKTKTYTYHTIHVET